MKISSISISNFKSYDKLDLKLNDLNILIGGNASGKSNFVDIFKFLNNIATHGIENAVSMQGGVSYLRNLNLSYKEPLSIKINIDPQHREQEKVSLPFSQKYSGILTEINYELELKFFKTTDTFRITKEQITSEFDVVEHEKKKYETTTDRYKNIKEMVGTGDFSMVRAPKGIIIEFGATPEEIDEKFEKLYVFKNPLRFYKHRSMIEYYGGQTFISYLLTSFFAELKVYNVHPSLSKNASLITGKTELERDGSNLALVLKNMLKNKERTEKIIRITKDVLPFVENVSVEKFAGKFVIPFLKESYCKEKLPASLISEGTINVMAIILALYFEKNSSIIFEEPERNLHPSLISKVMGMIKDVSNRKHKQIIITTHNPEVLKHVDLDFIFFIHRDGCHSNITKPAESQQVKIFLKNELGVDELFIKGLLK